MRIPKMLCILLVIGLVEYKALSQPTDPRKQIIIKIGESNYTLEEFDYYFLKNTARPTALEAKTAIDEYLDLFTNFKLKVQEAFSLKMDEEEAFVQEFDGYKDQLIEPFLSTTKVNDDLIVEAYERLKVEIAGTHILVKPNAEDSMQAYNKILEYKTRIQNGEDMGELAKQYSDDRSAVSNKGYLGYFTSMQMVYPFENAAYSGAVGEVVGPFKTRFGYHILRIDDKRPARGQALAAHIMIRFAEDTTSQDKAEMKINSIYESLKQGKDWNELCKLYSDDKNTSENAGELKWFGTGQLVPEFEDMAFSMDSIGSISPPVKTRFGWHIIKLLDKKPLPPLDEQRADIEKRISKDSRTEVKQSTALLRVKNTYNYSKDSLNQDLAFDEVDSSLLEGKWVLNASSQNSNLRLFSIGEDAYTAQDFWTYIIENQKKRKSTTREEYLGYLYNQFEARGIFKYEKEFIAKNNQEYRMILDEYKSGILLFNLMEDKVWNKAIVDTTGLKLYYEKNKSKYLVGPKMKVRKLVLSDTTKVTALLDQLSMSNSQLDSSFNSTEPLTLQIEDMVVLKGENAFLDAHWEKGEHLDRGESTLTVWSVREIQGTSYQELSAIKGTVISDYQKYLEEEWIKELKKKYPVKVMKPVVKNYIKSFE